jgi:ketosteroid isomerase-like protein
VESRNLHLVKDALDALDDGLEAAVERLLSHAHTEVEFVPYVGNGRVLRGPDEIRAFFREQAASGTDLTLWPASFEERGDDVIVNGSLRVTRPSGGFAESQLSWTYHFRDGLLEGVRWGPRQAA